MLTCNLFRYSLATTVQVLLFARSPPPWQIIPSDPPQRLLDHLEEAGFYSAKDLESITKTLTTMRQTVERGRQTYSPHLLTLLESRLEQCQSLLDKLQEDLAKLDPKLAPAHETLVSILRSTSAANTRTQVGTFLRPWERVGC